MKQFIFLLVLLLLTIFSQTIAKVVGVSDGDTITIILEGNPKKDSVGRSGLS